MGGVADAISNAVSDVGSAIGNIASETVHAVESVGRTVGNTLSAIATTALNDPIGTIAKIGAVALAPATGGASLYALPAISAVDVVAHGGNLEQAALSAGISAAGMGIASGISDALTTSAESTLTSVANGADGSTVYNFSDGSTMTQTAAGETSFTPPTGLSAGMAKVAGGAAANAAKTLAQTGDLAKAITSGAVTGVGGAIGVEAGGALQEQGLSAGTAGTIGNIAGQTAAGTLAGQAPSDALSASITSSLLKTAMNQTGTALNSAWSGINDTIKQYNAQLDQTKSLYADQLTPAQQAAIDSQTAAKASYDNYNNLNSQFTDLQNQYNDAKAAGNTELANSLADKANALIPQLNDATDKYNTDATTFQTALDKFNTVNSQYTDAANQLSTLKDQYTTQNDQLSKTSAEFTDAAQKVAGMSNESQAAFTTALGTGADLTKAIDIATKVDGLSAPERAIYSSGVSNGLSAEQALTAAPVASNMDPNAQNVYFSSLKSGEDSNTAANKALLAQVLTGGQGITPTPAEPTTTPVTNQDASVTVTGISDAELVKQGIIPSTATPTEAAIDTAPPITDAAAPTDTAAAPTDTAAAPTDTASSTNLPNLSSMLGAITPTSTASKTTGSGLSRSSLSSLVNSLYSGAKNAPGLSTKPTGLSTTAPSTTLGATPTVGATPVSSSKPTHLTGQYTQGTAVKLMDDPTFEFKPTTIPTAPATDNSQQMMQEIMNAATGGLVQGYADGGEVEGPNYVLRGTYTRGQRTSAPLGFYGAQLPGYQARKFAQGGEVEGHNPQFFSEGGLNSLENKYVQGDGDGTSDSVPAMLANGEFVIPADVVSRLGNGSNQAGASVLDHFLVTIREHAQKHDPKDLPPDSKGPLAYLLDAKRKA
jgi:phage shock protein A